MRDWRGKGKSTFFKVTDDDGTTCWHGPENATMEQAEQVLQLTARMHGLGKHEFKHEKAEQCCFPKHKGFLSPSGVDRWVFHG